MKNKKPFAIVVECVSAGKWDIVVAGWTIGGMMTKESAEHCARDINQAHADGIKEAVAERDARVLELGKAIGVVDLAMDEGINLVISEYCSHGDPHGSANSSCYAKNLIRAHETIRKALGKVE